MFRKQFIISKKEITMPDWITLNAFDYKILIHPQADYCYKNEQDYFYCLIGNWYSAEHPAHSNKEILFSIVQQHNWEEQLARIQKLMGIFVFIQITRDNIRLVQDAAGLQELFYHSECLLFGSDLKLLNHFCEGIESKDESVKSFYHSSVFHRHQLFILHHTNFENFFKLLPNHYLDSKTQTSIRYFPLDKIKKEEPEEVANFAANYLNKIMYAISLRHKLAIPLTAGVDSRVLFLASLNIEAKYFVSQGQGVKDNHPDLVISSRIAKKFNKPFKIHVFEEDKDVKRFQNYWQSVTNPRFNTLSVRPFEEGFLFINGNVSEIARNFFGDYYNPNGAVLADWQGNKNHAFVIHHYQEWLKNKKHFDALGYHWADLFYWEERMGNWAAKGKTEFTAIGHDFISPFNSHVLLARLLSVDRKYRDTHFNDLYKLIIRNLAKEHYSKIQHTPFNPCIKSWCFIIGKRLKIYPLYKQLRGLWFTFKNRKKLQL